jgi:hypothetical protein
MAATYGSNIGSSANGAFAIFPISTTGADAIAILDADVVTGAVTAVPSAVALSALERDALSTLLSALIDAAAVGGNALSYLRKLVGVVSLTNGAKVTLSVANTVGNVWRLTATASGAGEFLVYIPSSVAAGPFTGFGADADSTVVPALQAFDLSGFAYGVLPPALPLIFTPVTRADTVVDFAASVGVAGTPGTLAKTLVVGSYANATGVVTNIGTIDFAAGARTATTALTTATFQPGTSIILLTPAASDATLASVGITLKVSVPL